MTIGRADRPVAEREGAPISPSARTVEWYVGITAAVSAVLVGISFLVPWNRFGFHVTQVRYATLGTVVLVVWLAVIARDRIIGKADALSGLGAGIATIFGAAHVADAIPYRNGAGLPLAITAGSLAIVSSVIAWAYRARVT